MYIPTTTFKKGEITMVQEQFYSIFDKNYDYTPSCPYTFGPGCAAKVGERLAMFQRKKAFVLTGPKVRALGYADKVAKSIEAAGIAYEIYDKTEVNPPAAIVHEIFDYMKDKGFDCIVAVGGGSVEDTGKALKHLFGYPDQPINSIAIGAGWKYLPKNTSMMLINVCTMNGTGCELSSGAVITSPNGTKDSCMSGNTLPDYAFIDSEFSVSIDAHNSIANACDAIAHAFNKLLITDGNYYMQKMVNLDLIDILMKTLPKSLAEPENVTYRSAIAIATAMPMFYGGIGCWGHAFAHTITHYFGTTHGIACAWTQPAVLRHYLPLCKETTVMVAEMLGIDTCSVNIVNQIVEKFIVWYKSVGVPAPADCCDHETWMKMGPDVTKDSTWFMAGGNYPENMEKFLDQMYHEWD